MLENIKAVKIAEWQEYGTIKVRKRIKRKVGGEQKKVLKNIIISERLKIRQKLDKRSLKKCLKFNKRIREKSFGIEKKRNFIKYIQKVNIKTKQRLYFIKIEGKTITKRQKYFLLKF